MAHHANESLSNTYCIRNASERQAVVALTEVVRVFDLVLSMNTVRRRSRSLAVTRAPPTAHATSHSLCSRRRLVGKTIMVVCRVHTFCSVSFVIRPDCRPLSTTGQSHPSLFRCPTTCSTILPRILSGGPPLWSTQVQVRGRTVWVYGGSRRD